MTKRDAIIRALKKSQGLPLEMQAITVEMYLEVADELAPSCDSAAMPQPVQPLVQTTNQGTGSVTGSPIIISSSMEEIPRISSDIVPPAQEPERPVRSFAQLVSECAAIPKAMDVTMMDGKQLRIGLRQIPQQDAEIVRIASYVPVGPDGGVEGPSAIFTTYETDLRIDGKLKEIAAGVRSQFRPVSEVRGPITPMAQMVDYWQNKVIVAEEPDGTPMRESGQAAPRSKFHELARAVPSTEV